MSGMREAGLRLTGYLAVLGLAAHLIGDGLAACLLAENPGRGPGTSAACTMPGPLAVGEPHGDSLAPRLVPMEHQSRAGFSPGPACTLACPGHPPQPLHPPQPHPIA
jgi:hypothetical protein